MALPIFARSLRPSSITVNPQSFVCQACTKRHESTYRRTRKALRVKPHADFLPSKTEPHDHIIFNPPSSAPSVYHTPAKFLPASDPRRKLHTSLSPAAATAAGAARAASSSTPASSPSPSTLPPVRPPYTKKYHLTQTEIDEIRRLRATDPRNWTRVRLAEKFECSQFFISLCCAAPAEVHEQQKKDLAEIKRKWGRRKTEAREARAERKTWWGKDA